jgi:Tfp pilus assembly protein PilV
MLAARSTTRSGLSLLEVIISLTVFLFSLVALSFLVTTAGNLAQETQFRSQAARLCQTKLAEVVAGAVGLDAQSEASFEEDPDYHWSLDVEQGDVPGLHNVTVRVTRKRADGSQVECSLSQMILDPSLVGSHLDTPGAAASPMTDSGDSSSPTSGTSTPASSTGTATAASAGTSAAAKSASTGSRGGASASGGSKGTTGGTGNTGGSRGGTAGGSKGK